MRCVPEISDSRSAGRCAHFLHIAILFLLISVWIQTCNKHARFTSSSSRSVTAGASCRFLFKTREPKRGLGKTTYLAHRSGVASKRILYDWDSTHTQGLHSTGPEGLPLDFHPHLDGGSFRFFRGPMIRIKAHDLEPAKKTGIQAKMPYGSFPPSSCFFVHPSQFLCPLVPADVFRIFIPVFFAWQRPVLRWMP